MPSQKEQNSVITKYISASPYILPQGTSQLTAFSNDGIGAINLQIGSPAGGGPLRAGAVYDGSTNVIVPLAPINTNVTVW